MSSSPTTISVDDFLRIDVRVGRIVEVRPFPAARKPAYQLEVDFGPELGRRRSSAQLTQRYGPEDLLGRLVLAVVNFPPRQIASFFSEVLVLGVPDAQGNVVLVEPTAAVPLGGRLY
jgi:tRNA-binding protein